MIFVITEYINEAMKRARYELINNKDEPYYGEIPNLKGVWATAATLEDCRDELREVLEGWIIIRLKKGIKIPALGKKKIQASVR